MRTLAAIIAALVIAAPTISAQTCTGDCGANLIVTVDELIGCVNIGLGNDELDRCPACDADQDGLVAINELVQAVGALLSGCPGAVPLPGICRRPNSGGTGPCAAGSRIFVYKCQDRSGCLSSLAARVRLGEGTVDASGRFAVLVDRRQIAGGLLLFEAEADDATLFRALDLGSAGSVTARTGSAGGAVMTVVDPASEATSRLLDESGLENFSDAGVLDAAAAVRAATATIDFAGLSAAAAADLATSTARDDAQVQVVLRRNATPTRSATATATGPTPTDTPPRTPPATATFTATPTPSATLPARTDTASPTATATLPPIFGPAQRLATGSRPSAVVVADLDADQVPDVLVANADSFDISVWLGQRGGGLSARRDFPVGEGTFPVALVVANLNNDDIPDVATADSFTDQVSILLGTGDGSFGAPTLYEVGVTPSAIGAGRFGGDEHTDLVTANRSFESVSVLFGGVSGPAPHELFAVGASPVALVLVDLDGDALLDLVTANLGDDDLSVLRGSDSGTFAAQERFPAGNGPAALAVALLDGNGVPDLATANANASEVAVFLRGENGIQLPAPDRFATGDSPLGLAIADLDGDGDADLVTANAVSDDISVLFGNGAGGFAPERRVAVGNQPVSVVISDVTGDGAPDVLTANRGGDDLTILPGLSERP